MSSKEYLMFAQGKTCPIQQTEYGPGTSPICEKERCAWWYEHTEQCSILSIAQSLYYLEKQGEK